MSAPDYPLLAPGGYETYQLAHIATYLAERLARHPHTSGPARAETVRQIAGAATALGAALGDGSPTSLPRPLDATTYAAARAMVSAGPRTADVVSLTGVGGQGWAVVGQVPGIGPVGAAVESRVVADALRVHLLTRPVSELTAWAVTERPVTVPALPRHVDLAAFVEGLDPDRPDDRAVARALRGSDRRTDAAIAGRFRGVDLDAPPIVGPPAPSPTASPASAAARPDASSRGPARPPAARPPGPHRPAATPRVPTISAGP